jgi:hypothetical protein
MDLAEVLSEFIRSHRVNRHHGAWIDLVHKIDDIATKNVPADVAYKRIRWGARPPKVILDNFKLSAIRPNPQKTYCGAGAAEMKIALIPCLALATIFPVFDLFKPKKDQPPDYVAADCAYFYCPKCDSLHGGIWKKGPTKHFYGPNRKSCVHDWRLIPKKEFKSLATEKYGVDWSKEIPFWEDEDRDPGRLTPLKTKKSK